MRRSLRLFLCLSLLAFTLAFALSCGTGGDETSTDPPDTTEEKKEETPFCLSVDGAPISDYVIVYAKSDLERYATDEHYDHLFPAYDFDRESAEKLSEMLFDLTGVRLSVVKDKDTEITEREILVGKTDRNKPGTALSTSGLDTDDCRIKVVGSKLSVCGGAYGTTWHAVDRLKAIIEEAKAKGGSFDLADGYLAEGSHHLIKIICIGDSITYGVGSKIAGSDAFTLFSYPTQLGRILWKDAVVEAYGDRGKTMRSDFYSSSQNHAYTRTTTWQNALKAAADADVVSIMLGTNDSQRLWEYEKKSWDADATEKYHASALNICKELKAKNEDLQFVLCNAVAYFGTERYGAKGVRDAQASLFTLMNESGYPTVFQDMYSVTKDMKDYFADKLHPDNEGHLAMAESLAKTVTPLLTDPPATQ